MQMAKLVASTKDLERVYEKKDTICAVLFDIEFNGMGPTESARKHGVKVHNIPRWREQYEPFLKVMREFRFEAQRAKQVASVEPKFVGPVRCIMEKFPPGEARSTAVAAVVEAMWNHE